MENDTLQRILATGICPEHPFCGELLEIIFSPCGEDEGGWPIISLDAFASFVDVVPHLFLAGSQLLDWLALFERNFTNFSEAPIPRTMQPRKVIGLLRRLIQTAGICAPADLWTATHILATHARLGILNDLSSGQQVDVVAYANERGLSAEALLQDFEFLHARMYMNRTNDAFSFSSHPRVQSVLERSPHLQLPPVDDIVGSIVSTWEGSGDPSKSKEAADTNHYLSWLLAIEEDSAMPASGIAGFGTLKIGCLTLLLTLAVRHLLKGRPGPQNGQSLCGVLPSIPDGALKFFEATGMTNSKGNISALGERVLAKGHAPFGIVYSYREYFSRRQEILGGADVTPNIIRSENLEASQDAGKELFRKVNKAIDRFCYRFGFQYTAFVEHALGRGEALRQRYFISGESVTYFGADIDDSAIQSARIQQKAGGLPEHMILVPQCDIATPEVLLEAIRNRGCQPDKTIVVVGNGFHEIRDSSDDRIVHIFSEYQRAGIVLILTEESLLTDKHVRQTGWNTYHASFRYVHAISGQRLRLFKSPRVTASCLGWGDLLTRASYKVLEEFSFKSRTIFPCGGDYCDNPPISVTYFCIPTTLAIELEVTN